MLICLGKHDVAEGIPSAEKGLRKFSDLGAWYAIKDCAQYNKKSRNQTSDTSDETIADPNAPIVEDDIARILVPRLIAWLDYDEHVDILSTMDNEVGVMSPEITTQILSSFEVYTPPVTCPEEVDETIGILMEVEPLDHSKLEDLGLKTYTHDLSLSSRGFSSVNELKPQLFPNFSPLDVNLGDKRENNPPINPYSPSSFRIKVGEPLTIHTPPSPHVAYLHPKGMYLRYHPFVDDPKKHYGFKQGLLGQSEFLSVDLSNWEVIENNLLRGLVYPFGQKK
uniref:Uncharacterized protein n=1 Tax=Tanacetum cinerariifolium TaxID=118510 RepID=A0A699HCF1_TANCI|nr:hypothetical protein [Tanacetum cinerariifolium]